MTFARSATVAVPLPPRDPGSPPSAGTTAAANATRPPARPGAVTGRDTALLPLYPAGRLADDRETALLPVCGDDFVRAPGPLPAAAHETAEARR